MALKVLYKCVCFCVFYVFRFSKMLYYPKYSLLILFLIILCKNFEMFCYLKTHF